MKLITDKNVLIQEHNEEFKNEDENSPYNRSRKEVKP